MVVTLVSPFGEYGGPLRVAVNQSVALAERGHTVTIAGSYRGYDVAPSDIEGVPTKLFPGVQVIPKSGFAGLAAPRLWAWLARAAGSFDVAHIHAARDLVTLPAARTVGLRGLPYVLQPHGMIDESDRAMSKPLDKGLTVPVLTRAHRVFFLTPQERDSLQHVAAGKGINLAELPNGVPETDISATSASSDGSGREVLYLARLAGRKRPDAFVRAAEALSSEFPDVRFVLVGPDEGEGAEITRQIERAAARGTRIAWEGAISPAETLKRMSAASVYVLPSVDEPYPMSVLEAMSVGLPVVITKSCGLAEFVERSDAGIVVGHDDETLIDAMRRLLSDPAAAQRQGAKGRETVRAERSMCAIATSLETAYTL